MNGQRSVQIVLVVLTLLVFGVLSAGIWRIVGALVASPAAPAAYSRSTLVQPEGLMPQPMPAGVVNPSPLRITRGRSGELQPRGVQFMPVAPSPPPGRNVQLRFGEVLDVSSDPAFADLAATPITLNLSSAPPEVALAAFAKASSLNGLTDNLNVLRSQMPNSISMHLYEIPLLEGVLELANRCNASISTFSSGRLALSPIPPQADTGTGAWCVAGPFAVIFDRMEAEANLNAPPGSNIQARLFLRVLAEPKVKLAQFPRTITIDEFTDENGVSFAAGSSFPSSSSGRSPSVPMSSMQIAISLPPNHGHKITALRGHLPITLMKQALHIDEALSPTAPISHAAEGLTVEISLAATNQITVRVARKEMEPERWNKLSGMLNATVPVPSANGQLLNVAMATGPRDTDSVTFRLVGLSPRNPPPDHITWDIPTETQDVPIPFSFENLILP